MSQGFAEDRLVIPFSGPGEGTGPLTWGQKAILQDMRETGWTHNVTDAYALPEGVTAEDVADWSRELMSTFPALRVRLGTDAQGGPCQVISPAGEIGFDIVDVADDTDPAEATRHASDLWYKQHLEHFDMHRDWLMRSAVVRHRGVAMYWVWTLGHILVDAAAVSLLMGGYEKGETVRQAADPKTLQILDLGRREQTPAARQVSDRAMRYWESHLRPIPSLTFGEPTHPEGRLGKRYWHGRFNSPAAYLAVLAIAERTRTDTSRVLLALLATSIGRVIGISPLTAKVVVGNRFRPGFAGIVAPLSQNSVLTLDVADVTVDEAVARTRRAELAAGMYAYYDPEQLEEVSARLDAERGYAGRVTFRVSDRRLETRRAAANAVRGGGAAEVTMERIREKTAETWIAWDGTVDYLHDQALIVVEDTPETVRLQVIFDMACFTEEQVEALLRGVEEAALEAAFDPAAPTRVKPS